MFASPSSVSVEAQALGLPPDHAHQAVAGVHWTLRQRARAVADEDVPTGACIARTAEPAEPLDEVRNPNDPADETSPPVALLPAGPENEPGAAGIAEFLDRYVDDAVTYRYGVSECDPFGRWSPFIETEFRWDDLTPPPPPAEVSATLEESGLPVTQVLTTSFSYQVSLPAAANLSFELHLRRISPPSATPVEPSAWGFFERASGTFAGPLAFEGDFDDETTHDGMTVLVSAVDEQRSGPTGDVPYRVYTIVVSGVVIPFDANDRAQAWVAVRVRNAKDIPSSTLGGPAKAEDFRIAPPPPPQFPPEPLLATYPDADNRSSITFALPGPRRAVVYRAGEHDLAAMAAQRGLAVDHDPNAEPIERSAVLRAVAPLLRDAFQPVTELLPASTPSFTDDLAGSLQTLMFYTTVSHSPALVPGSWPSAPDGFVAVAVPKIPKPAKPLIVRAIWTAGPPDGVELLIAEPGPGSAPISAFEVYRTLEATSERANDWRTMRPCGRFEVTDASFEDRGVPPRVLTIIDNDAVLPWTAYLYRVVARAVGQGAATRSEPSAVVRVVTHNALLPDPPFEVAATLTAEGFTVTWRAAAPTTPAGRFRFEIIDPAGPITRGRIDADDARDATDPELFRLDVATTEAPATTAVLLIDPDGQPRAKPRDHHLASNSDFEGLIPLDRRKRLPSVGFFNGSEMIGGLPVPFRDRR